LSLRSRIAGVLQDTVPYELTAVDNITLGDLDHYGEVIVAQRAAEEAGVLARLERLPCGLETMLSTRRADADGDSGSTLSGGEWQRVAIARALARQNADLLILDEPTAGLDPEAEHDLHVRIMRLGVNRTRLLISHRLSALRAADHIVVLDQGRVVEQGRHEELLEARHVYAHLFNLQAAPYAASGIP
jgi:ATP-binding cassette subfamily B protein